MSPDRVRKSHEYGARKTLASEFLVERGDCPPRLQLRLLGVTQESRIPNHCPWLAADLAPAPYLQVQENVDTVTVGISEATLVVERAAVVRPQPV